MFTNGMMQEPPCSLMVHTLPPVQSTNHVLCNGTGFRETLKSRTDKAKLQWWYKLASMPVRRYPRQPFDQEWKVKPRRGRQRKLWKKYVGGLFEALGLHEEELLDDI